jgi:hypothetical protein
LSRAERVVQVARRWALGDWVRCARDSEHFQTITSDAGLMVRQELRIRFGNVSGHLPSGMDVCSRPKGAVQQVLIEGLMD